jgi:pimeloyl-CoA synthetase
MEADTKKALQDLAQRLMEMSEGQSRFMNMTFTDINDMRNRIRSLEMEVATLRKLKGTGQ